MKCKNDWRELLSEDQEVQKLMESLFGENCNVIDQWV